MIITCPTPQRAPTLNRLWSMGTDLHVVYLHRGGMKHGWGSMVLDHPHVFEETSRGSVREVLGRMQTARLLVTFGYREPAQLAALVAARVRRVPVVARFDANVDDLVDQGRGRRMLRKVALRTFMPSSTVVWSIGSKNEDYWRKLTQVSRFVRIPYEVPRLPGGLDPTARNSRPDQILRILYVGRLALGKRVDDLISAVLAIGDAYDWRLNIVGDGPEAARLRDRTRRESRIAFIGSVEYENLAHYYLSADVLVLPSQHEAWGLTVNEALGFGLRVVVSHAVGAAHDLINESNGETFRVGDVDALREALNRARGYPFQEGRRPSTDTADLMNDSIRLLIG